MLALSLEEKNHILSKYSLTFISFNLQINKIYKV